MRAKKSLGQHFLHDRAVAGKIMTALDVQPDDRILEIGPGTGSLTRYLAATGADIHAVEIDGRLAAKLKVDFQEYPNVTVIQENALDVNPCALFPPRVAPRTEADTAAAFKIVGNIPYYITGALIRHYLESSCQAERIVVMVQREVADRMTAGPGDMSVLAVATQFYATPSIVAAVPSSAFRPRPKVASAVVKLVPRCGLRTSTDVDGFFQVVKAGFSTRRKQLVNSLSHALDLSKTEVHEVLNSAGINPASRAEDLTVEKWLELTTCFVDKAAANSALQSEQGI